MLEFCKVAIKFSFLIKKLWNFKMIHLNHIRFTPYIFNRLRKSQSWTMHVEMFIYFLEYFDLVPIP